jgi:DNA invertase Pin-like site-specific DNA recombinase
MNIDRFLTEVKMADIIAYYRVSTNKQEKSGLGLEAQQAAIATYANQTRSKVLAAYTEIESGKVADRPELAKALAHARRIKGTLVVAKLDRLARNVEFLAKVMNSGADFVAADNPAANRFVLYVLGAVAEQEREAISARTKAALAAAKARGTRLGSARLGHWDGKESQRLAGLVKARKVAAKVVSAKARVIYADLLPILHLWRSQGKSLRQIAHLLNEEGQTTRRNKPWNAEQVRLILKRG